MAVGLARETIGRLPPETASRGRVFHSDVLDLLSSLESASVDAVHTAVAYQGLSDEALERLFLQIHRVLVPNGLHLWSVRTEGHAGKTNPEMVPPNFPELGFTVQLRFFDREEIDRLTGDRFERIALEETSLQSFYVADRKRAEARTTATHDESPGRLTLKGQL